MTASRACRLAASVASALVVASQAGAATPLAVSANLGASSDYRWRGLSLSDRKAVIQGGVDVSHSSGVYLGLWGSSLPAKLGRAEIDVAAGWSFDRGATSVSIGVLAYLYPFLDAADYVEFSGSATRQVGPVEVSIGASFAPKQKNVARSDLYLTSDATFGLWSGVSAKAHVGVGRGPSNLSRTKLDWSLGAAKSWKGHELSITYVDNDEPTGRDADGTYARGVVVGVRANF